MSEAKKRSLSEEETRRLVSFFEILMQIDRRLRSQKNKVTGVK